MLYAIVLGWPQSGEVTIRSLGSNLRLYNRDIEAVHMLGAAEPLAWSRDPDGLRVKLPADRPCDHAFALRIAPRR